MMTEAMNEMVSPNIQQPETIILPEASTESRGSWQYTNSGGEAKSNALAYLRLNTNLTIEQAIVNYLWISFLHLHLQREDVFPRTDFRLEWQWPHRNRSQRRSESEDLRQRGIMDPEIEAEINRIYLSDHIAPMRADIEENAGIPGDAVKRFRLDIVLQSNPNFRGDE